jgi:hypothetical protein
MSENKKRSEAFMTVGNEAGQVVLQVQAADGRSFTLRNDPETAKRTALHILQAVFLAEHQW